MASKERPKPKRNVEHVFINLSMEGQAGIWTRSTVKRKGQPTKIYRKRVQNELNLNPGVSLEELVSKYWHDDAAVTGETKSEIRNHYHHAMKNEKQKRNKPTRKQPAK